MADTTDAPAPLKVVLFLGSVRQASPFWGGLPPRVGDRVVKFVQARVAARNAAQDASGPKLEVSVVDPVELPSVMSLAALEGNPTYYATRDTSTLPADLQKLVKDVEQADAYLVVCPEYNHTIPPALTAMMNFVGCSKYANKVSGSITYSGFPSAAGGARCAVALRPFLSELGCLPVSKQAVLPNAPAQLNEDGEPQGDHASGCIKQVDAVLEQLEWWAEAARTQRQK